MPDPLQVQELTSAAKCVCGHLRSVHYAEGTCLGAYRNPETKKEADATVCPCPHFREGKP